MVVASVFVVVECVLISGAVANIDVTSAASCECESDKAAGWKVSRDVYGGIVCTPAGTETAQQPAWRLC